MKEQHDKEDLARTMMRSATFEYCVCLASRTNRLSRMSDASPRSAHAGPKPSDACLELRVAEVTARRTSLRNWHPSGVRVGPVSNPSVCVGIGASVRHLGMPKTRRRVTEAIASWLGFRDTCAEGTMASRQAQ